MPFSNKINKTKKKKEKKKEENNNNKNIEKQTI